jgi:hypothetical protein
LDLIENYFKKETHNILDRKEEIDLKGLKVEKEKFQKERKQFKGPKRKVIRLKVIVANCRSI